MLPVADGVDADVAVLAGGEDVLGVDVDLHVVEGRLADDVGAAGELGVALAVAAHVAEDDALVGAARDHLDGVDGAAVVRRVALAVLEELDGRDGGAVVVEGRDEGVVAGRVEDVDEAVARRRGEQAGRERYFLFKSRL